MRVRWPTLRCLNGVPEPIDCAAFAGAHLSVCMYFEEMFVFWSTELWNSEFGEGISHGGWFTTRN